MDEYNREYSPIDEYPSIDDNNTEQTSDTTQSAPVETKSTTADDVFEAFDKAHSEKVNAQPTPQPQEAPSAVPYQAPPTQYTPPVQPQYNTPVVPYGSNTPPYRPYTAQQNMGPYANTGASLPPQPPVVPNAYAKPPYTPPYQQYAQPTPPVSNQTYNPYAQNTNVVTPKNKKSNGTKVLIGVLIGLLVLFMLAFFVSCTMLIVDEAYLSDYTPDNPLSEYGATENIDPYYDFFGEYGNDYGFYNNQQYSGDTFKEKITLQADEGETQQTTDSKKGNTYSPDKDAKDLNLESLPKDSKNSKYTTQSAYNTVTDAVVSVVCYEDKITDNENDIIGEGTGTVISSDGYIVTNSHVISDSNQYAINIVLNNADEYEAKVVGFDTRTDLAVLKIKAKNLTYAKFGDSSLVEVGQDIVAIGNPGGQSFQNSLTKGIVSAVDRELDLSQNVTYIQLDAAINPGNSGGPLCNIYGQVIGINTAKIASQEYEGMGFAIPSATVCDIANDLIHYGYVKDRVRLGLMGTQVSEDMVYKYGVPYGILISEITEGGPLDNTDIMPYDILTEINGEKVESFQDVYGILSQYKAGDKVTLTLYRLEY